MSKFAFSSSTRPGQCVVNIIGNLIRFVIEIPIWRTQRKMLNYTWFQEGVLDLRGFAKSYDVLEVVYDKWQLKRSPPLESRAQPQDFSGQLTSLQPKSPLIGLFELGFFMDKEFEHCFNMFFCFVLEAKSLSSWETSIVGTWSMMLGTSETLFRCSLGSHRFLKAWAFKVPFQRPFRFPFKAFQVKKLRDYLVDKYENLEATASDYELIPSKT